MLVGLWQKRICGFSLQVGRFALLHPVMYILLPTLTGHVWKELLSAGVV